MIRVFEVGGANRYDYNDTTPAYLFQSCPTKDLNVCRNINTDKPSLEKMIYSLIYKLYLSTFLENKSPFVVEDPGSRNAKNKHLGMPPFNRIFTCFILKHIV